LDLLPRFDASNNWALAPARSASGQALLANDPHLGHGQPPIWYEAHLKAGALDVTGVIIPGLPFFVLGHNRDIAWGFTNLMVDAADFFIERVNPDNPKQVWHSGKWEDLQERQETIQVRGRDAVELTVRISPHGPIVTGLAGRPRPEGLPENKDEPAETRLLAYQWLYWVAEGDPDAFHQLNHAHNWKEFREAAKRFGAVTQNAAYADREGHIAMQTIGKLPRRKGNPDGTRYREGDGSQDWDGFLPFEQLPFTLDPPRGWVASANNPPFPEPAPYYLSTHYEPPDRITRIRELLKSKDKFSRDDLAAMQADTVLTSAVRLQPLLLQAFAGQPGPAGDLGEALDLLGKWNGDMRVDSAAATIFAAFYERLFPAIFADELGEPLVRELRGFQNVNATMMNSVFERRLDTWFDRVNTPEREDRNTILRDALNLALTDLSERLGGKPAEWQWGKLHELTFVHPIGRLKLFAPYFNVGPFPVPGHANTVNKMQYHPNDWKVYHGPSMRQITDFGDLDASTGVIPTGESGIPASPHYADQTPLWLKGQGHPLMMDRAKIEAAAEATLTLVPGR
jgi:penicillin amidase